MPVHNACDIQGYRFRYPLKEIFGFFLLQGYRLWYPCLPDHLWDSSSCVGASWHVDSTARGLGSPKANSVWISKRYASKARHPLGEIFWWVTSIPPPLISIAKDKYYKPDYKFVLSFFSLCFPNLFQIQSVDFGLEPAKDPFTGLLVLGWAAS